VPPEKISFIPNACDFSLSDHLIESFDRIAFRKERGWTDKFVVTYVGAHGVANHLVQLLDAAAQVSNTPVHIVLIGDGMQKPWLQEEAKRRAISNVEFIDSMPKREIMKYLVGSDAGASVLKRVDTFKTVYSNKTFDYMACKKPILMLIDGVSRQLVEGAKCGIYAEPEHIEEIVSKLNYLLHNKPLCETMGQNGYHYAKQNFDRNGLAKEYIREIKNRLNIV